MSIDVRNLFFTYNTKSPAEASALQDISLNIERGDFVALVGHTGSGKSTLAQCLNGLLIPTRGEISVDEFLIQSKKRKNKNIKKLRKHISIVFQFPEYQLFEDTIEKDVAFGPKNFKVKDDEAIRIAHESLKKVGIDESYFKKSPFELSGGEKRRVAIAGIIALNPDIYVLDEPTAGLDFEGKQQILDLIVDLNKSGKTIILITHDLILAMKYCNKVCMLKYGKVHYFGGTKDFLDVADENEIEIPPLYKAYKLFKERYPQLDITKIKNIEDLLENVKELRGLKNE